ncbi:MAG: hypothetical protein HKN46_02055 [Acidimicrobiia bacterium]|nr:hypothetical protein [Acidimicrobiia bacterium]
MRRITIFIAVLALGLLAAAPAFAARGGEQGSPIQVDELWADGEQVGTIFQKGLKYNGNEASYDHIFLIEGQAPVAEAAPGNSDYNGGRWLPTPVEYSGTETITSYADLMAAVEAGLATIGDPIYDAAFLCPVIPNH